MSAYGSALGQAMPILSIPTTLIGSFTLVLVPSLSENFYAGKHKALQIDMEKAIKFTVFVSSLFVPVFFVCGEEAGVLLYGNLESGRYITIASFLMLLMGLSNITTSMLNSMGFENLTLIYFIIGMAFMLLSVWILPSLMGIYSLFIGFASVYGITTLLNLIMINRKCTLKPRYLRYVCYSIIFLVPTCIFGIMLEKALLPFLGNFLTMMVVSVAVMTFQALLYPIFGLVDIEFIKSKLKLKKNKTPKPI
jgi:O-antigen/teichoic acid export membrane protein